MPRSFREKAFKRLFHLLPHATEEEHHRLQEVVRLCQQDPDAARTKLAEEQRALVQALEETWRAYEDRLMRLARRIADMDADAFKQEVDTLRESQIDLWRVVRRMQVANRDTHLLLHEWQDWQQCRESAEALDPVERKQREEMLRSELMLRGVSCVPEASWTAPASQASEQPRVLQKQEQKRLTEELLPEWDEVAPNFIEGGVQFWEKKWAHLPADTSTTRQAEYAHQLRQAHAAQRLLDRQQGIRRYRLSVFDPES